MWERPWWPPELSAFFSKKPWEAEDSSFCRTDFWVAFSLKLSLYQAHGDGTDSKLFCVFLGGLSRWEDWGTEREWASWSSWKHQLLGIEKGIGGVWGGLV